MASPERDATSSTILATNGSTISLPASLATTKRRLPGPTLSLKSIRPFHSPGSNLGSEGLNYLSPPILTPSLMSPPPRNEAEDYWTSHASHGSKKRYLHRNNGALRLSPYIDDHVGQKSAAESRKGNVPPTTITTEKRGDFDDTSSILTKLFTAVDETQRHGWSLPQVASTSMPGQAQLEGNDQQPFALPEECPESPAMASLRRLSEAGVRKPSIGPSMAEEISDSFSGALTSNFKPMETSPQTRKQSIGNSVASNGNGRRRSSAFRGGHRRLPKKEVPKPAASGLSIPASIVLRKATGLFSVDTPDVSTTDTQTEQPPQSPKDLASASTISSLIAFNSRQFSDQERVEGSQSGNQPRKQSTISAQGLEFSVTTPSSSGWGTMDDRFDDWAAPVITVADVYPPPTILSSATQTLTPNGSTERHVSVVQITSRKSVHRIIWCEDDQSSSSEASSDRASPTELTVGEPADVPGSSENSPPRSATLNSQPTLRQNLKAPLHEEEQFPPDVLVESGEDTTLKLIEPRPGGQMFKWTWGMDDETPVEAAEEGNDTAWPLITADKYEHEPSVLASSSVPQLMVPDEDEEPRTAPHEAIVERRGSFMLDPSARANIGTGRELGSRRSISVHPLTLARFANYGASGDHDGSLTARRPSRVA
ncbi:MAG: hypothetical protein Q9184_004539 [Pyrenodesmia sp. 2 TL-2023]